MTNLREFFETNEPHPIEHWVFFYLEHHSPIDRPLADLTSFREHSAKTEVSVGLDFQYRTN
jgi:hypothetical protein